MKTRSNRRGTPEMIVAMTALFIAISGTAVGLPGKDKVNSGDIKNETLRSEDLRDGQAVRSSDVVDGELSSADIANGTLQTEDYALGSVQTNDLGDDAVQSQNIADSAVSSATISDGSIAGIDLAGNSVSSSNLASGAVGAADLAEFEVHADQSPHDFGDQDEGNNDYEYGSSIATCPIGSVAIAGGGEWVGGTRGGVNEDELQAMTDSVPTLNGSWIATAVSDVDNQDFRAVVLCLTPGT